MSATFSQYFTLEEAVAQLPFVQDTFAKAHAELDDLHNDMVLTQRMLDVCEDEPEPNEKRIEELENLLQYKWQNYQAVLQRWLDVFTEAGIQVKDMDKGLIDFPYQTQDGRELLLCWHLGEDGLFYFHELDTGFKGRKPISLLPQ